MVLAVIDRTLLRPAIILALVFGVSTRTAAQCCGDCNSDGSVAINELITAVNNALGGCATATGCGLLATGQHTSYGPGSDGDVRAGVDRSARDNEDGTVTDMTTGLMWEKKDDAGGIHDQDNTYTWGQADPPYTMNGTMLTAFLSALNTPPCFVGHCDWRVPNIRELASLLDYEVYPATFSAFNRNCAPGCTVDGVGGPMCSCTSADFYWSSTTVQLVPYVAWDVTFEDGLVFRHFKITDLHVRAVRGGL